MQKPAGASIMAEGAMGNAGAPFAEIDKLSGRYGRYETVLGHGSYKTVYKGFDRVKGIEVAWNRVNLERFNYGGSRNKSRTDDHLRRLCMEVRLLKHLNHKNIIRCFDSWVDLQNLTLDFITEMCSSGTLREYGERHRSVNQRAIRSWLTQILHGLAYLHAHNPPIAHRDLKCDNIFVNGNTGELKIGDLGLAFVVNGNYHCVKSQVTAISGTPAFMAPEILEGEYDELVDIYAFGMCVLELITLEYPYEECSTLDEIFQKSRNGEIPESINRVKDSQARDLIQRCLAPVEWRPSAAELLEHPFVLGSVQKPSRASVANNGAAGANGSSGPSGPDWEKCTMKSHIYPIPERSGRISSPREEISTPNEFPGMEPRGARPSIKLLQRNVERQLMIAERRMDEFARQGEETMESHLHPHDMRASYPDPRCHF